MLNSFYWNQGNCVFLPSYVKKVWNIVIKNKGYQQEIIYNFTKAVHLFWT